MPSGFVTPSGAGGPAAGTYLPVAAPAGVTVDTTTFDNPNASGKITTLVFPGETSTLAWAQSGDTFPRVVFGSEQDDGILMGRGNATPRIRLRLDSQGQRTYLAGYDATAGVDVGFTCAGHDTNILSFNQSDAPLLIAGGAVEINSGSPAATRGGNVGDYFLRIDTPGTANQRIYICTVAGVAGAATWVGIV